MGCDMSTVVSPDQETLALLGSGAEFRSISREEMLREAIVGASEYDRKFRASVEADLRDIAEGREISSEQMENEAQDLLE